MTFLIHDLHYRYDETRGDVLTGVTATIERGQRTAIVGLSGSGKSTLLSLLGLLVGNTPQSRKAASGKVLFERPALPPVDLLALDGHEREIWRLRKYGFILQSAYLLPHFTGANNVMMPLALLGVPPGERRKLYFEQLDALKDLKTEFFESLQKSAWRLSGGERQRAAVLRAVIHNPEVVFADEPTSNLDITNRNLVISILEKWHKPESAPAKTLVLVTHDVKLALTADKLLVLWHGRLAGNREWSRAALGATQMEREETLERLIHHGDVEEKHLC